MSRAGCSYRRKAAWAGIAALAACAAAAPAAAHLPRDAATLDDAAKQAELVFRGVVEKVEYASSTPEAKDDRPIPHTFVTYRVEEVLKGAKPGKRLTLRFAGGRGEGAAFLVVANYPLFDVGDEDVLFVRGNGFRTCPLVGCAAGRLRSIDGKVYSERGNEARLTEKGTLHPGPQHDLEPVRTHKVSQTVISRVSVEETGAGETPDAPPPDPPGKHLTEDELVAHVRDVVKRTHTAAELASLRPVVSADPKKAFTFKVPPQVGPPKWSRPPAKPPASAVLAEERSLAEGDDLATP